MKSLLSMNERNKIDIFRFLTLFFKNMKDRRNIKSK